MLKISCSNLFRYALCPSALNHEQVYVQNERAKAAQDGVDKHLLMQKSIEGEYTEVDKFEAVEALKKDFLNFDQDFDFENCVCEEKFSYKNLENIPFELIGVIDLVYVSYIQRTIYIIDYKFGYVPVSVESNYQLRAYAHLIYKHYDLKMYPGFKIKIGIFQDSFLRITDVTTEENLKFENELLDIVMRSQLAQYVPNSVSCKWCSNREHCAALIEKTNDAVTRIYDARLHEMTDESMFEFRKFVILNKKLIEIVLGCVESYLKKSLQNGAIYDFCNLKSSGSLQLWRDDLNDTEITAELSKKSGLDEGIFYERKLKSPAQIKKIIGDNLADFVVIKDKAKSLEIKEDSGTNTEKSIL